MKIQITKENYEKAIQANSGSCLVADAIKEQYPQYSNIAVDVATIRFTDRKKGERYIYLTGEKAYETLLFFDQGWPDKSIPKTILLKRPIKILPIARSESELKRMAERRASRLAELEAKEQIGNLTSDEARSLTKLRVPKPEIERPKSYGAVQFVGKEGDKITVRGGRSSTHGSKRNANLLAGRTRHFGKKIAQPSQPFKEAVKEAVLADRAKRRRKSAKARQN